MVCSNTHQILSVKIGLEEGEMLRSLIWLAIIITCSSVHANLPQMDSTGISNKFSLEIQKVYKKYEFRGDFLFAVVTDQGLQYYTTLNRHGDVDNGLDINTPFLISSHTKAFTGTLGQILSESKEIDLNAPLSKYLDAQLYNPKISKDALTVKQLLNHTAGFTSVAHTFKTAFLGYESQQDLSESLNETVLVASPGKFRYSNTGPILAAQAIEGATKNSWQSLMIQRIFVPLQMENTSFSTRRFNNKSILPMIEVSSEGELFRQGVFKSDRTLHASGGVISTLKDMAKWIEFNILQGDTLSDSPLFFEKLHNATVEQNKQYFTYLRKGYSYAWDIAEYQDWKILTRFGGYGGMSFHASFIPDKSMGIVAFFNESTGFALPHLAANYWYNLNFNKASAQQVLAEELVQFDKIVLREEKTLLSNKSLVRAKKFDSKWLGTYVTGDKGGWPEMQLYHGKGGIWARWGDLSGPLIKTELSGSKYVAALGPIRRSLKFDLSNDGDLIILNGSIKYKKLI